MRTVQGTLRDARGLPVPHGVVRFKPLSTPLVAGGGIVTLGTVVPATANAAGVFNVNLHPGDYEVWADGKKQFRIGVIAGAGAITIDLLVSEALVYTGTALPALDAKVNRSGDTLTGPLMLAADPVQPLEAATRQFVESEVAVVAGEMTALETALTTTQGAVTELAGEVDTMAGAVSGLGGAVTDLQSDVAGLGSAVAAASTLGRHTLWLPAASLLARTTNGAAPGTVELATNKVMLATLDFDAGTREYAQTQIAFPKSWSLGALRAEVLWTAASGSGNVVWAVQALAVGDDDALDAAFGTAQPVTDTLLTANDLHRTAETGDIAVASAMSGDLVVLQVFRQPDHASDTLAVDARLLGLRIFYTINAATDA
jgi:hypothetical protein